MRTIKRLMLAPIWLYCVLLALYLVARQVFGDRYWPLAVTNIFGLYLLLPVILFFLIALILRARRLALVALIFTLILAFWYGPTFIGKTPTVAARPFSVVSFNIYAGTTDTAPLERYIAQTQPDVLMLQETPQVYAGREIAALKAQFPYQTTSDAEKWNNATFSKWPIVARSEFGTDSLFKFERVTIDRQGEQIVLYNVHLPYPLVNAPRVQTRVRLLNNLTQYNDSRRNEQLRYLIGEIQRETLPYIIAGDFNLSDQSPIYGTLPDALGIDSYREAGWGLGATWPNAPVAGYPAFIPPMIRIDYQWHSSRFRAVSAQVGPNLGSDHFPVIIAYDFLPGAGAS